MRVQKEKANAKINLFLDVVAKREDGFHDIKSVMHSVSLCDEISVKYIPSSKTNIRLIVSGNRYLPTDSKNLAYRAAALYLEKAAVSASIEIKMKKNIPVASGLGGGSADSAAVLRAMNKLFGRLFSERALISMAAELGSDVPFCLNGKTALCEGRGEIMTRLPASPNLEIVIAVANEYMSTPHAYKKLDELYSDFDGRVKTDGEIKYAALLRDLKNNSVGANSFYNIFENAVFPMCPRAESLKQRMLELGARVGLMSGSGPSVFGVFDNRENAQSAAELLKKDGVNAFYAHSAN